LKIMKKRGVHCYLASGTDEKYVFEEAELLELRLSLRGSMGQGMITGHSQRRW